MLPAGSSDTCTWDADVARSTWACPEWLTDWVCAATGTLVLTGSIDATCRLWDVRSGRCLSVKQGHTGEEGAAPRRRSHGGRMLLRRLYLTCSGVLRNPCCDSLACRSMLLLSTSHVSCDMAQAALPAGPADQTCIRRPQMRF
jgi:hypothetical protein